MDKAELMEIVKLFIAAKEAAAREEAGDMADDIELEHTVIVDFGDGVQHNISEMYNNNK